MDFINPRFLDKMLSSLLTIFRKIYIYTFGKIDGRKTECDTNPISASQTIFDELTSKKACMIARFGSTELMCLYNYTGIGNKNYINFIKGEAPPFWWQKKIIYQMQNWSGFFPPTEDKIEKFCELMLDDMKHVDVLGSWLALENKFEPYMVDFSKVHLRLLEPFWTTNPWTRALKNKKILVVHPFSDDILFQYSRRKSLFKNQDILPKFKSLSVIKAVQSLGQGDKRFKDWFEALDYMKNKIDSHDYDICLIAAGAYGFPLAAHVKRMGKKSVHLGGALQLLFGIKGKRWEDPNYGVKEWGIQHGSYSNLINDNWIRPNESSKPKNAQMVEGACYW